MKKLLLISNSASQGQPYLGYAAEEIGRFLGPVAQDVLFVPYAAITCSWDEYVAKVNNALGGYGVNVTGLHTYEKPLQAIASAQAIMVGGGNTWALLKQLQDMGCLLYTSVPGACCFDCCAPYYYCCCYASGD